MPYRHFSPRNWFAGVGFEDEPFNQPRASPRDQRKIANPDARQADDIRSLAEITVVTGRDEIKPRLEFLRRNTPKALLLVVRGRRQLLGPFQYGRGGQDRALLL